MSENKENTVETPQLRHPELRHFCFDFAEKRKNQYFQIERSKSSLVEDLNYTHEFFHKIITKLREILTIYKDNNCAE